MSDHFNTEEIRVPSHVIDARNADLLPPRLPVSAKPFFKSPGPAVVYVEANSLEDVLRGFSVQVDANWKTYDVDPLPRRSRLAPARLGIAGKEYALFVDDFGGVRALAYDPPKMEKYLGKDVITMNGRSGFRMGAAPERAPAFEIARRLDVPTLTPAERLSLLSHLPNKDFERVAMAALTPEEEHSGKPRTFAAAHVLLEKKSRAWAEAELGMGEVPVQDAKREWGIQFETNQAFIKAEFARVNEITSRDLDRVELLVEPIVEPVPWSRANLRDVHFAPAASKNLDELSQQLNVPDPGMDVYTRIIRMEEHEFEKLVARTTAPGEREEAEPRSFASAHAEVLESIRDFKRNQNRHTPEFQEASKRVADRLRDFQEKMTIDVEVEHARVLERPSPEQVRSFSEQHGDRGHARPGVPVDRGSGGIAGVSQTSKPAPTPPPLPRVEVSKTMRVELEQSTTPSQSEPISTPSPVVKLANWNLDENPRLMPQARVLERLRDKNPDREILKRVFKMDQVAFDEVVAEIVTPLDRTEGPKNPDAAYVLEIEARRNLARLQESPTHVYAAALQAAHVEVQRTERQRQEVIATTPDRRTLEEFRDVQRAQGVRVRGMRPGKEISGRMTSRDLPLVGGDFHVVRTKEREITLVPKTPQLQAMRGQNVSISMNKDRTLEATLASDKTRSR